jgi:hypothetical protein
MEGRGTGELGKAIETVTEDYIKSWNLGFAEYEIGQLSIQSYGLMYPSHKILLESVAGFRSYKMRKGRRIRVY